MRERPILFSTGYADLVQRSNPLMGSSTLVQSAPHFGHLHFTVNTPLRSF